MLGTDTIPGSNAGVAQLVERNLAKVEVESSRLFSRSRTTRGSRDFQRGATRNMGSRSTCGSLLPFFLCLLRSITPAGWQSGHAAACKAVYAGSIPTPASIAIRLATCNP